MTDAGARLLSLWRRLGPLPAGAWVFSRMLGWFVPYTGTIGARVRVLEPGHAVVTLRDRRRVRNHLRSVHAVALVNLGEMTSGLAMLTALPPGVRGIVTALTTEYFRKARGTLTADCHAPPPPSPDNSADVDVVADIRDGAGQVVARTSVRWRVGPG